MKNKLNILILDNNRDRLLTTTSLIKCCDDGGYCVDPKPSIDQDSYENNHYDVVFVHYGNLEADSIRDCDWNSDKAVIVYFGGEFRKDKKFRNGRWYVSPSFIGKKENICSLMKEII
jgi:hypothetical protein